MAGIPRVVGGHFARLGLLRVLIRAAVVAGLVVVGWLLGAATALAQPSTEPPAVPSGVLATAAVEIDPAADPLPAADSFPAAVLGLPVQPAQPEPAVAPVIEPVLAAVHAAQPALGGFQHRTEATAPRPTTPHPTTDRSGILASAGALNAEPPLAQTVSAAAPVSSPAAPLLRTAAHPAQSLQPAAADSSAGRAAGSVAGDDNSTLPSPASPAGFGTATCPGGSAGASATTKGPHAVSFSGGGVRASLAPALSQRYLPVGHPPSSPSQQPSTSPD